MLDVSDLEAHMDNSLPSADHVINFCFSLLVLNKGHSATPRYTSRRKSKIRQVAKTVGMLLSICVTYVLTQPGEYSHPLET